MEKPGHVVGLDIGRPTEAPVTIDGQRIRNVTAVVIDAPAGEPPVVTISFLANEIRGVEQENEDPFEAVKPQIPRPVTNG